MPQELLRPSEAAARLKVSVWTIYRWIKAGKLDATKMGHGTVRVLAESVERLIAAPRSDAPRPPHAHGLACLFALEVCAIALSMI